jgi:hypothetical protein
VNSSSGRLGGSGNAKEFQKKRMQPSISQFPLLCINGRLTFDLFPLCYFVISSGRFALVAFLLSILTSFIYNAAIHGLPLLLFFFAINLDLFFISNAAILERLCVRSTTYYKRHTVVVKDRRRRNNPHLSPSHNRHDDTTNQP